MSCAYIHGRGVGYQVNLHMGLMIGWVTLSPKSVNEVQTLDVILALANGFYMCLPTVFATYISKFLCI